MSGSTWAPVFISYGRNNRTHMLRIPTARGASSRARSTRRATRTSRPRCSSQRASSRIESGADPGPPIALNMYTQSDGQVAALGVQSLPRTLLEAVDALDADPLAGEVFGSDLHQAYVEFKRAEWNDFHNTVSEWEWRRYLTLY